MSRRPYHKDPQEVTTGDKPTPKGLKPWQPGQSGNPGGLSKEQAHLRKLLNKKLPDLGERLLRLCYSEDEKMSLAAIKEVFDRTIGRPKESVSVETSESVAALLAKIVSGRDNVSDESVIDAETLPEEADGQAWEADGDQDTEPDT